jgi:hypothetical protein
MAFTFGTYTFPINPTSYTLPAVKNISLGYSVDGTLLGSSPLLNQNEFSLSFDNVTEDMNSIVSYLKTMIVGSITNNRSNVGLKAFSDNIGLWSGNATLIKASCFIRKYGNEYVYNFTLTFRLN